VGTAFAQNDAATARKQWCHATNELRPMVRKLTRLLNRAEADVLVYVDFPVRHRAKLHSTNPIQCLNGEIKPRSDVVDIFPNEAAVTRILAALLLEQNDESAVQRARCMTLQTIEPLSDNHDVRRPPLAA
jgi:transposase-like protein